MYDLCVIGGGINGAGITRDAAGRGLSVLLLEARDLAAATSSASTKLIHGGLRYLEYYEFGLVRDSLKEREVLLKSAPHIIWPLDIILPHDKGQRPFWMLRAGLFLYDHLGGRKILKASRALNLRQHDFGVPLADHYARGFSFSDCWVEDSRLVVLNAMDAAEKGADIHTYEPVTGLSVNGDHWAVETENGAYAAHMVVNAAGPWVREVLEKSGLTGDDMPAPKIKLVKGSHIIVPRQYDGDQCYLIQQPDGRIMFVIPYERNFTLIGTTEENYEGDPYEAAISDTERNYLIESYNRAFSKSIMAEDIVWDYSGVRPLFDDGEQDAKAVTRDYRLHDHDGLGAPMISIFGGKLTTYRVLSEKVANKVCRALHRPCNPWTENAILPGGNISDINLERFLSELRGEYDFLPGELARRYARAYGLGVKEILKKSKVLSDLGKFLGDNIYEAEIRYLIQKEWARTAEDILWRRSKLGLHVSEKTQENIREFMKGHV